MSTGECTGGNACVRSAPCIAVASSLPVRTWSGVGQLSVLRLQTVELSASSVYLGREDALQHVGQVRKTVRSHATAERASHAAATQAAAQHPAANTRPAGPAVLRGRDRCEQSHVYASLTCTSRATRTWMGHLPWAKIRAIFSAAASRFSEHALMVLLMTTSDSLSTGIQLLQRWSRLHRLHRLHHRTPGCLLLLLQHRLPRRLRHPRRVSASPPHYWRATLALRRSNLRPCLLNRR
jgi:hypothetical protein